MDSGGRDKTHCGGMGANRGFPDAVTGPRGAGEVGNRASVPRVLHGRTGAPGSNGRFRPAWGIVLHRRAIPERKHVRRALWGQVVKPEKPA